MEGQPHTLIKAKAFEYVMDNAAIKLNPVDWFGFNFAGTKYKSLDMEDTLPPRLPSDKEIKTAEKVISDIGLRVLD